MNILSSFTHAQVVANLYEFLSSAEHKGRYFEELFGTIDYSRKNKVNGAEVPIVLQNIYEIFMSFLHNL